MCSECEKRLGYDALWQEHEFLATLKDNSNTSGNDDGDVWVAHMMQLSTINAVDNSTEQKQQNRNKLYIQFPKELQQPYKHNHGSYELTTN